MQKQRSEPYSDVTQVCGCLPTQGHAIPARLFAWGLPSGGCGDLQELSAPSESCRLSLSPSGAAGKAGLSVKAITAEVQAESGE